MGIKAGAAAGFGCALAEACLQVSGYQSQFWTYILGIGSAAFLLYAAIAWIGGRMGWKKKFFKRQRQRDSQAGLERPNWEISDNSVDGAETGIDVDPGNANLTVRGNTVKNVRKEAYKIKTSNPEKKD